MGVDSTRWPTYKIVNSVNNYLDYVAGFFIASDKRFQWDDTNHTKLPEGTTTLTASVSDYSFLTDEQGNRVLTLTGVSILLNGKYVPLDQVDRNDPDYDASTFGTQSGTPTQYDKVADNVIRLNYLPSSTVASGLKFYFQRTPSYFAATDTTKEPGVANSLHRGFVISAAYDGALALGLKNLQGLANERIIEEKKVSQYFSGRNNDDVSRMTPMKHGTK